jgi:DNA-binding Lrp family transcriptional regulator
MPESTRHQGCERIASQKEPWWEILLLAAGTRVYKARLSRRRITFVEHHKLDSIDLRILAELQANGRITNVELSRRAKITAPPCLRRMRALEKAGYIQGYHADLDAKALGFEVAGFVFVGLASQNDSDLKRFEEKVRSWPEVRECHMLSGEVDFLLKCVAADLSAFQTFITEKLTAEKNVASVKSSLVIHATKHEPGVPIELRS